MYDEADSVFIKTIDDILQEEETEEVRIVAEKEVIHDINLNPLGLVYDFSVDDSVGYAIVLQQAEEFIVPEIFLDAVNPYKEVPDENCKKIYLNTMSYLYYNQEGYFEPKTQLSVDTDILEQVYGSSYKGGGVPSYTSETISYTYRNENNAEIDEGIYFIDSEGYIECTERIHITYTGISFEENTSNFLPLIRNMIKKK